MYRLSWMDVKRIDSIHKRVDEATIALGSFQSKRMTLLEEVDAMVKLLFSRVSRLQDDQDLANAEASLADAQQHTQAGKSFTNIFTQCHCYISSHRPHHAT